MTGMRDVARLAGVSAKTVSRVFNNEEYVSGDVRARVTSAMKELNYLPNVTAKSFRTGRTSLLATAVPDLADPFFGAITEAIDALAKEHGYALAVTSLGEDPTLEQNVVEALLGHHVSGLIIAPVSSDQSYLDKWLKEIPIVFVDREPRGISADVFVEDDRAGTLKAMRYLIKQGHQRIAFVGDSDQVVTSHRRFQGYQDAIEESGVAASGELILWADPVDAPQRVADLLRASDPPTAIFSSNSRTSVEIVPMLQYLSRTDVALLSFGDFPMAAALSPAVTVVDQNPHLLGTVSAQRMIERLQQPSKRYRRRNVLNVELIERDSSTQTLDAQLHRPTDA